MASHSLASPWDSKCTSGGFNENIQLLQGKREAISPLPTRGTGRLSAIAEREQPWRHSSSKPSSSHGKTLLPSIEASGRGFYQGSSPDTHSPGFPQKVHGRVRFVGRDVAHNRIPIFNLFLLQPDAVCPFFQGVACRENKSNMLRSFLCQGWEAKSEPNVQNLKDTFCAPEVNLVPRCGWKPASCWDSWE